MFTEFRIVKKRDQQRWQFYIVLLQIHSDNCIQKMKKLTYYSSAWLSYCKINKGAIFYASQSINQQNVVGMSALQKFSKLWESQLALKMKAVI